MTQPSLLISKIGPESVVLLQNLLQLYVHDMSEWFQLDVEPDGTYAYDASSIWDKYDVYLAKLGDSIAGFALIGPAAEWLGDDKGAHDVHEFFVLRRFRRAGVGASMAKLLWSERRGEWLVRVIEANTPAVPFWRAAIAGYTRGSFQEETRIVNARPWRFFRFTSARE